MKRTGPDCRSGQEITGQHYLDTFGFQGGEFGNWMNQNDRQASLNMGFEALKDLAAVLQISDQNVAFGGTLAIAFGARGSGNAAAHYEPLRKVINLTKMHGAGSLAHEWWHGFDDYLGTKMGAKGMLSEQPRLYPLFQKLIDTMKYKPETPEQVATFSREYKITLIHQLRHTVTLGTDIFGNIQRLDNALGAFEERMAVCVEQLENTHIQLDNAKTEVQKPFPQEEELAAKTARLNGLNALLNLDKKENEIVDGERGEEEPQKATIARER